jgi:two-component system, chemotaxis family, chemotaxis protein CheY
MMTTPVIVLVGHCGPDFYALRSAVSRAVPGSEIVSADDNERLAEALPRADLLLVNRVLESGFGVEHGTELIAAVSRQHAGPVRWMLISNYPEAQASAEAAGALPGFGKRDIYADETRRRIRGALGLEVES